MTRRPIAAANWKMHKLRREAEAFCAELSRVLVREPTTAGVEVLVFPSPTLLPAVATALAGSAAEAGGQDLHVAAEGAHTGDVSGPQLVDAGARWALCGHSERRRDHREDDEQVGMKARAARDHGLRPLICLGETREERRAGKMEEVLRRQLSAAMTARPSAFEIAYEPVWAIGTGETATPEMAQEAHAFLRRILASLVGEARSAGTRILYGGSAKPGNVAELIVQPDIDGFLIGGASLDVEQFLDIIRCCGAHAAA